MAFAGFDVLTINTADSEVCVSHEITDNMRSLIISIIVLTHSIVCSINHD